MTNTLQIIKTFGILSFALMLTQHALGQKPNQWKDIIFTEILPDPTPRVGLPEAEYIELSNRSDHDINLKDWKINDSGSSFVFPDIVLNAGAYLIVSANSSLFTSYGVSVGSKSVPSLNNDNDLIRLFDSAGVSIDSLHYFNSWYDRDYKDGGWALELIDPMNICSGKSNWAVSEDDDGGTPGIANSVLAEKPDFTGPFLQSAIPIDATKIQLTFNEPLAITVPDPTSFHFEPPLLIAEIAFSTASLNALHISLNQSLQQKTPYSIQLSNVFDCAGNDIHPEYNKLNFALPENALTGDVVINEILFNPKPGGVDFIELFNASDKFIDLQNWSMATVTDQVISDRHNIKNNNFLLNPHDYFVLTEDVDVLLSDYQNGNAEKIFQGSLPKMNDDAGNIIVVNAADSVIDHFDYAEDMQSIFIKNPEGVSLERISTTTASSDITNWSSASSNSGFATPGYENSNSVAGLVVSDHPISVEPSSFIPVSGQPAFTRIHYRFGQPGYVANVTIHDERGRIIKHIASNELLGTDGYLRWDGDQDDGYRARTGYYLIHVVIFDATGSTTTFNEGVAVASKF
ncbi:MAG: lamin tail domain-containing protein [Chryseolinea sp.]